LAKTLSPRRHYLRVEAEQHPGLDRRIDSLVRQAGLTVQSRASRGAGDRIHLGFLISACSAQTMSELQSTVAKLARVKQSLCLGVLE
jgi:hypothetical protein